MAPPPTRPTTEVSDVILDSMDRMFGQLLGRLECLTADEYLWEPVAGSWSVRVRLDAVPLVEGAGVRDIDPAPVTTIAWRLWHIAIDCFDDYTRRFGGDGSNASAEWTTDADEAIKLLGEKWTAYRRTVADANYVTRSLVPRCRRRRTRW